MSEKPYIVGLGGTTRPGSSSERALSLALAAAAIAGARTCHLTGCDLNLPIYDPGMVVPEGAACVLIEALRHADGIIISSPCYHGGVSGMLKNALDYTEMMRADERAYFDGRSVGVIGTGFGYQGPGTVVQQLRQYTHALRGWNVPLGVAINSAVVKFEADRCSDPFIAGQIETMAMQVVSFCGLTRRLLA
ncbi:NADPH-dependent FMN reductase [Beijerinckia sp. L45]|uniref:NADPH-dependent FMN reductase n=1 Tax=Beijerinckia sp. L45 TaxID=1641855 RepID=UPI00131D5F41|nr:NADPH-dependent FMN reductase [Beijerinckia sp. L45]